MLNMNNTIKTVGDYTDNIVSFVTYIINRNNDIDTNNLSDFDIEMLDNEFYRQVNGKYEIFINNHKYCLNSFMTVEDAKYVLNNINNISYVFSEFDDMDTLVGCIDVFIKTKFGNNMQITDYFSAIIMYENYVQNAKEPFTENDIYRFIERKIGYDTTNK